MDSERVSDREIPEHPDCVEWEKQRRRCMQMPSTPTFLILPIDSADTG